MNKGIEYDIVKLVQQKLDNCGYDYTKWSLGVNEDGKDSGNFWGFEKQNFEVVGFADDYAFNQEIKKLKSIGGKYIRVLKKWNRIRFYLDLDELRAEYVEIQNLEKAKHLAKLNAIDITEFRPSPTEIRKIMDYKARRSRVNVKAIKTDAKLFRYYYAACLVDWKELKTDIKFVLDWNKRDVLEAIELKITQA